MYQPRHPALPTSSRAATALCSGLLLLLTPVATTARPQTPPAAPPATASAAQEAKPGTPKPTPKPERFEKQIAAFEARDREKPPAKGGVVFVGSSSIGGWRTLLTDFPDVTTLNRGFGGSIVPDSVHFADRIVLPYRPRAVVFYAGDNDISGGRTPGQVLADFQAFVKKVRDGGLPDTVVYFLAIKPSLSRWHLWDRMGRANALVRDWAGTQAGKVVFVDVATPMLGTDGKPRPELFKADRLHMTPEGYQLWTRVLTPHLAAYQNSKPAR